VRILLSRDSVAAGDDVESHDLEIEVDERRNLSTFIQMTVRDGYLPRISGGNATWVCMSGRRGRRLAVVAEQWKTPQLIVTFGTQIGSIGDSLHFRYVSQRSPQDVLDQYRATAERGATAP
jgi:hypothetical protein